MQPNETPHHPIDYLDSISTVPKKPAGAASDKLFFGVIIGAVVIILAVIGLVIATGGPSTADELSRLSVRLENLQEISDESRTVVVSSSLRATNANLSLALTNANRDIQEPLAANGINPEKISSSITEAEDTTELKEKLEDARLNAIYDRTYAREMSYELETLLVLITQLEDKTRNEEQKEFLSTLRSSLEPLQKQFSNFSAAS